MDTQERIEALERKCNRMRASQMALVGVLAAVFLVGAAQKDSDKVLRAGKLEIVNDQGGVVAELGEDSHGDGLFELFRKNGGHFLIALAERAGGTVTTLDGKGQKIVGLGVSEVGEGAVTTYNGKGQKIVELGVSEAGRGMVTTFDGKGQELVGFAVTKKGEGAVVTYDRAGNPEYDWPPRP